MSNPGLQAGVVKNNKEWALALNVNRLWAEAQLDCDLINPGLKDLGYII